ncbi:MAG: DUF4921 family protein [Candidatus Colwellbacteria bacterium]|nr:DUF4921 family protein [Candidatus Colwellbacteria bacterium]
MKKGPNGISEPEFREDLVSGDWILIAPGRNKRPDQFVSKEKRAVPPIDNCPFENPQASGNADPILRVPADIRREWEVQVIPNKYPAVSAKSPIMKGDFGPYLTLSGFGHHDVVITRDHFSNFPKLSPKKAFDLFKVFQERYRMLAADKRVAYVSIFHNWGAKAGASVYHPHYQMISIPVIPPDVAHSLSGATRYFRKNRRCVHCDILSFEMKAGKRVICESEGAVAFAPFTSREPFEFRVFPKKHLPYFEETEEEDLKSVVEVLRKAVGLLERRFPDIDYNIFIHTAPTRSKGRYAHYHWHVEVMPKVSISAGFELSTGIEITVVDPDEAAEFIRKG